MIRSCSHAAAAALRACAQTRPEDVSKLAPWAHVWHHWTAVHFLRSYLTTAAGASFLPVQPRDLAVLLEALLLEKALEELHEALHRGFDWLQVPLQGLGQLLCLPADIAAGG